MMLRFFVALLFVFSVANSAVAAVAEAVWIDFDDGQHHVMLSRYDGEAWSQPSEIVYTSSNPLATPVLGTMQTGDKILLWAEKTRLKVVLMSARASDEQDALIWQFPWRFSDRGLENMAPALVTDLNGHLWVFWSSSTKLPSDLYYRKFDGNSWSDAELVNKMNKVPDNGAVPSLDERGNVVVQWNTYDLDLGAYTLEKRTFLVENLGGTDSSPIDVVDPSKVPEPDFVPEEARSIMHFPGNSRIQSMVFGQPANIPGWR